MSGETRARRRDLAAREAAEWLAELRQAQPSAACRGGLVEWLRESPLNIAEFLRIARVSRTLDHFEGWDGLPAVTDAQDRIIPWSGDSTMRLAPTHRPAAVRRHRLAWVAAAAGIAVGAASWIVHLPVAQTLRTAAGERREMTLTDGSLVSLAPATEVRVRFTERERNLRLTRGEAFFRVHKNPRRPFVVQVNDSRVRAVGTAFGVRLDETDAVVTVVEGVVSVSVDRDAARRTTEGSAAAAPVLLGANQQARIPADGAQPSVRSVTGSVEMAWTAGELLFDNEPLSDVVRRFNVLNRLQIVITDPVLATRRVSGVFRASDPESFVAFIQTAPAAPAARREGDRIYVGGTAAPSAMPSGH